MIPDRRVVGFLTHDFGDDPVYGIGFASLIRTGETGRMADTSSRGSPLLAKIHDHGGRRMESGVQEWREDLGLYEDLRRAAERQLERIEAGDMEGFQDASNLREGVQARISALEARIGRTGPRGAISGKSDGFQEIRDRIRAVALEIQETDRRSLSVVKARQDRVAQGLDQLKKGRKGVRGYGRKGPRPPKFVDQQG